MVRSTDRPLPAFTRPDLRQDRVTDRHGPFVVRPHTVPRSVLLQCHVRKQVSLLPLGCDFRYRPGPASCSGPPEAAGALRSITGCRSSVRSSNAFGKARGPALTHRAPWAGTQTP